MFRVWIAPVTHHVANCIGNVGAGHVRSPSHRLRRLTVWFLDLLFIDFSPPEFHGGEGRTQASAFDVEALG